MILLLLMYLFFFFFSSRRRHTRSKRDWSSDVCSSDLIVERGFSGRLRPSPERPGRGVRERFVRRVAGEDDRHVGRTKRAAVERRDEIGRASCRERVEIWGVAGGL